MRVSQSHVSVTFILDWDYLLLSILLTGCQFVVLKTRTLRTAFEQENMSSRGTTIETYTKVCRNETTLSFLYYSILLLSMSLWELSEAKVRVINKVLVLFRISSAAVGVGTKISKVSSYLNTFSKLYLKYLLWQCKDVKG